MLSIPKNGAVVFSPGCEVNKKSESLSVHLLTIQITLGSA